MAEQISNSIAADENGGVNVVTRGAQYKFGWAGHALGQVWRAEYETGGSSAEPSENSFFAASEVGPGGSVWSGVLHGVKCSGR